MFPGEEKLLLTRIHVPLLFYSPLHVDPGIDSSVASEVDVLPSIATLTLSKFRNNALGRSLFNHSLDDNRSAFFIRHQYGPEIGVIQNDHLFQMKADGSNKRLHNIFAEEPERNLYDIQRKLGKKLERFTRDYYETAKYLRYNNHID